MRCVVRHLFAIGTLLVSSSVCASSLYLELDGRWYVLPDTAGSFMFSASSGLPSIYLPFAQFTLCAPMSGTQNFGSTFLFYGPLSFPVYEWKTLSYSALNGLVDAWIVTITTVNGTIACTGEIPSPVPVIGPGNPVSDHEPPIFFDDFENVIFRSGFEG